MPFPFRKFASLFRRSKQESIVRGPGITDPISNLAEIELPVCHNESARPMTEVLETVRLGPHLYQLIHSPGTLEGLARGDIVKLKPDDPRGFEVVSRSGNLCVWFYFAEIGRNRCPDGDFVRESVERFGGTCDGGGNTNLIFSIPVPFGFPAIEALFNGLTSQFPGSSWLFGNVYDPWNGFVPLAWCEAFPPFSDPPAPDISPGP